MVIDAGANVGAFPTNSTLDLASKQREL